ncbi:hypothetical protein JR316_0006709 [Psilocybe cubensis]|uniref:Uncharacterized protein n=2 Tax=Psilocybe cubensis TaxID=181762 RepID=A0ACB8GXE0_PSICU|nr:hypothetical protein JR316_0006709 [Psilocybe cubensis]KAH9480112.1 hypothetical protein JR316_0006709 [Psilocybe cubensis]
MIYDNRYTSLLALCALTLAVSAGSLLLPSVKQSSKKDLKLPRREKLPKHLEIWKFLSLEDYIEAWGELRPLFERNGFQLWKTTTFQQVWNNDLPPQGDNFLYLTSHDKPNKSLVRWNTFSVLTACLHHAARMNGVRDVVLRVVSISGEGQTHLRILKRLVSPPDHMLSSNHILPILHEFSFEDIVIIAVPKLIFDLREVLHYTHSNSVEDALYMVLQALEASSRSFYPRSDMYLPITLQTTAYIHDKLIAHRDLYLPNFMVEWMPESLSKLDFLEDSLESDRVCTSFHRDLDQFGRYIAPELRTKEPYCPFKLDMWQLGEDLRVNFVTGMEEVDRLWLPLCVPDPQERLMAGGALKALDDYLRKTPSIDLHRPILDPLNEPMYEGIL